MGFAPTRALMKRLFCGLAAVAMTTGMHAADSGSYFKFDVGPNYLGKIHQDFVNLDIERDLDMNMGVRGSVAEGFLLNRFIGVELETGVIWNELDESFDWLMQVPLLANLVLRYECKGGFAAYVGAGGGGAVVIANATFPDDVSDATIVPAWQAMAGVSYNFSENLAVGLVYKYMGIKDAEIELKYFGMDPEISRIEKVHNHYGGVQLTYSF